MTCVFRQIVCSIVVLSLWVPTAYGQEDEVEPKSLAGRELGMLNIPEGRIGQRDLQFLMGEVSRFLSELDQGQQALASRVDALNEQSNTGLVLLREDLNSLQNNLSELQQTVQSLSDQLQNLRDEFRSVTSTLEESHTALRTSFSQSVVDLSGELENVVESVKGLADDRDDLSEGLTQLSLLVDEQGIEVDRQMAKMEESVDGVRQSTDDRYGVVQEKVSQRSIIGTAVLAILAILVFFVAKRLRSQQTKVASQLSNSVDKTLEQQNEIDLKVSQLLEDQLRGQTEQSSRDHTFFIALADEINRMRKRLGRMSAEEKGIRPLEKALERLERGMGDQGYEIADLLNKPYTEGMNVKPTFIPDDTLSAGEQRITNIVKPQVSANGKVIQVAEIEVSVG